MSETSSNPGAGTEPETRFDTPSWLDPRRQVVPPARAPEPEPAPAIPVQAAGSHDRIAPEIPETARWVEHAKPRLVAGLFLALSLAGVAVCLYLTIVEQTPEAVIGLVACAFIAVVFRGAMMSTGVFVVELKGSRLSVHHGGDVDTFNLADPVHLVELVGSPGESGWKLVLECVDGRVVELTRAQVDPVEMHRIVAHYREIAGFEKRERERRFNR